MTSAVCRSCKAPLADHARFCARCGAAVVAATGAGDDALRTALEREVAGRYRIERLLGRGGMGAVYLGVETALDREVAIKVLPPDQEGGSAGERFRREAKTAARLSHPGIVPLFTFGEAPDLLYYVMGYVEGESLAQRVKREGRLSTEAALRILGEVADALQYAHAQNVVHRDIKVDNILLEHPAGRAVLADFGLAKAAGPGGDRNLTGVGLIVGTPGYMSPEQARGDDAIDARSDIYSLGVVAFALLAGRLPFEGRSAHEIMRQHISTEAPSVRDFNPDLPKAFEGALRKCLAKNAAERFATAPEFVAALRDTSSGMSWLKGLVSRASTSRPRTAEIERSTPTSLPASAAEFARALESAWARIAEPSWAEVERPLRSLVERADRADARALRLARDADAQEIKRLERKIAALAPEPDDPPERAELRRQLEAQHQTVAALARRAERDRDERQAAVSDLRSIFVAAQKAAARRERVSSVVLDRLIGPGGLAEDAGTLERPADFDSMAETREGTAARKEP